MTSLDGKSVWEAGRGKRGSRSILDTFSEKGPLGTTILLKYHVDVSSVERVIETFKQVF